MDCFLIFSYEILKFQIFFWIDLGLRGLIRVNPCNLGPDSLTGSTLGSSLITMLQTIEGWNQEKKTKSMRTVYNLIENK